MNFAGRNLGNKLSDVIRMKYGDVGFIGRIDLHKITYKVRIFIFGFNSSYTRATKRLQTVLRGFQGNSRESQEPFRGSQYRFKELQETLAEISWRF